MTASDVVVKEPQCKNIYFSLFPLWFLGMAHKHRIIGFFKAPFEVRRMNDFIAKLSDRELFSFVILNVECANCLIKRILFAHTFNVIVSILK